MLRQLVAGLAILACVSSVQANYRKNQAPITSLEDAAKMIDLSAGYVITRNDGPAHFLLVPNFKIKGFEMQPMSYNGSNAVKKGSTTDILNSVGYYMKMEPKDYKKVVTANNWNDSYEYSLTQFSCIQDKNDDKAKLDVMAINPKNVDLSIPASSLTPQKAQEALHQMSKGYRHIFMGDIEVTGLSNLVSAHPAGDMQYWDRDAKYDNYPNDIIVNVCVNPKTGIDDNGVDYLRNGKWANELNAPSNLGGGVPFGNIYTWGPGGDYQPFGSFYAEWDNEADKKAALAGDVTKKAPRLYVRGVRFELVKNPAIGSGVVHNAKTLLAYYHKAGLLTDNQLKAELQQVDVRENSFGAPSPTNALVNCKLNDSSYKSAANKKVVDFFEIQVGGQEYDRIISGQRRVKFHDAKVIFTYKDGSKITKEGSDYAAYYQYHNGDLVEAYVEDEAAKPSDLKFLSLFGLETASPKVKTDRMISDVLKSTRKGLKDCTFNNQ